MPNGSSPSNSLFRVGADSSGEAGYEFSCEPGFTLLGLDEVETLSSLSLSTSGMDMLSKFEPFSSFSFPDYSASSNFSILAILFHVIWYSVILLVNTDTMAHERGKAFNIIA